mmetsp:Transcript_87566/g.252854  ORF Transcript_87566/g.252854 Transcript_87566/m.252854 type:complete len:217 (+) Transcript_87566:946-1596(+)
MPAGARPDQSFRRNSGRPAQTCAAPLSSGAADEQRDHPAHRDQRDPPRQAVLIAPPPPLLSSRCRRHRQARTSPRRKSILPGPPPSGVLPPTGARPLDTRSGRSRHRGLGQASRTRPRSGLPARRQPRPIPRWPAEVPIEGGVDAIARLLRNAASLSDSCPRARQHHRPQLNLIYGVHGRVMRTRPPTPPQELSASTFGNRQIMHVGGSSGGRGRK